LSAKVPANNFTATGRGKLKEAEEIATRVEAEFFGGLLPEQREQLQQLLAVVLANRWPSSVCV